MEEDLPGLIFLVAMKYSLNISSACKLIATLIFDAELIYFLRSSGGTQVGLSKGLIKYSRMSSSYSMSSIKIGTPKMLGKQ
jgi:hypothetical protein